MFVQTRFYYTKKLCSTRAELYINYFFVFTFEPIRQVPALRLARGRLPHGFKRVQWNVSVLNKNKSLKCLKEFLLPPPNIIIPFLYLMAEWLLLPSGATPIVESSSLQTFCDKNKQTKAVISILGHYSIVGTVKYCIHLSYAKLKT